MYLNLFMCLHVVCVLTILVMPWFLHPEKSVAKKQMTTSVANPKEIISNANAAEEISSINCDTNLNETKTLHLSNQKHHPYTNGYKTIKPPVLVRSHSTGNGALPTRNDRNHLLFDSEVDMRRFNQQMDHNGGGSLHQRITAGSFMHHIDAKF